MSIFDHWQQQRESLRAVLTPQLDSADAVRHIRHTLLQTEQNALAEMSDDVLRQQASVLFGALKGCTGLLEAHGTAQVWVAQKAEKPAQSTVKPRQLAAVFAAAMMAVCLWRSEWLIFALGAAALISGFFSWFSSKQDHATPQDEMRVCITVDPDRLFAVLDSQLRIMDRYLTDFSLLNEQTRGNAESADTITLNRAAELMESLYDCDEAERAPVEEAAHRLLEKLGLQAVDYTEENSRLFNALPSKSTTRTLSPAIVSLHDHQLLKRGTAAVRMPAA